MNILHRKRRDSWSEYVLVDRGHVPHYRWVVATANTPSLALGEWYWGHYFETYDDAVAYYEARPE